MCKLSGVVVVSREVIKLEERGANHWKREGKRGRITNQARGRVYVYSPQQCLRKVRNRLHMCTPHGGMVTGSWGGALHSLSLGNGSLESSGPPQKKVGEKGPSGGNHLRAR
jgi:hypothetical protein